MTKEIDTSDYWPSCTVCLENYDEEGDHVPRLLPCSHTVCESCIKALIANDYRGNDTLSLKCPECRKHHGAPDKEKSFTQNKYILDHIRSFKRKVNNRRSSNGIRDDHGRQDGDKRQPLSAQYEHT